MEQENVKDLETRENQIISEGEPVRIDSTEDDLERAIEVIDTLPKEQRVILSRGLFAIQQSYSGPLPPAKEFKGYKDVLPDAPERIVAMAEKNQEYRMRLTDRTESHEYIKTILGQVFGFALSLMFGGGAVYLGIEGHDKLAGVLGCTTVISLAAIFVLNRLPALNKDQAL